MNIKKIYDLTLSNEEKEIINKCRDLFYIVQIEEEELYTLLADTTSVMELLTMTRQLQIMIDELVLTDIYDYDKDYCKVSYTKDDRDFIMINTDINLKDIQFLQEVFKTIIEFTVNNKVIIVNGCLSENIKSKDLNRCIYYCDLIIDRIVKE